MDDIKFQTILVTSEIPEPSQLLFLIGVWISHLFQNTHFATFRCSLTFVTNDVRSRLVRFI